MSLPTDIYQICALVKARLAGATPAVVGDPSQILVSVRDEHPHIKGNLDILIRPRKGQQLSPFYTGGGRNAVILVRVIDIFVRSSFAGSALEDDDAWLAQHVPIETAVLNALIGQMLTDRKGNDYLTCPINYLGTTEEKKEKSAAAKNLWGDCPMSFEFHFQPNLDLSQTT